MWSLGVVVFPPLFDDDFCLLQAVENPLIQKFIPEAGIEELAIAVLPRRAGFNVNCFGPHHLDFQSLTACATNSGSLPDRI